MTLFGAIAANGTEVTEAMVNESLQSLGYAVAMKMTISDLSTDRWYYKTTAADAADYTRFQPKQCKIVIPMHVKKGMRDWNKFEFYANTVCVFECNTYKNTSTGSWTVYKQNGDKVTSSSSVVTGVDDNGDANAIYYVVFDAPELTGNFRCETLSNNWGCFCQYGCFLAIPTTEKAWQISLGGVETTLALGEAVPVIPRVIDRISGATNEDAVVSSIGFGEYSNLSYENGTVRARAATSSTAQSSTRTLKTIMDIGDGVSLTNSLVFSVEKPSDEKYAERVHIQPGTVLGSGNWTVLDSESVNAIRQYLSRPGARLTIGYQTTYTPWWRMRLYVNSQYWFVAEKSNTSADVSESIYYADGFDPLENFVFNFNNGTITDISVALPISAGFTLIVR